MDKVGLVNQMTQQAMDTGKVEQARKDDNGSLANEMKQIRKARLHRQAFQDPSLYRKLVAAEASPVYNAKGEVIQALSTQSLDV
jgi:hypothetical protein